ncbi:MAG: hypothetical protein PHD43_11320 [Methylococcales bacterium]|nr:hypothetical protein [Methylococcales bacterium]
MTLAETIYQKSLELPDDKAIEVIDFIDFIKSRSQPATVVQPISSTPSLYQAFSDAGLIGCIETDEQLATTYKEKLDFSFKHGSHT